MRHVLRNTRSLINTTRRKSNDLFGKSTCNFSSFVNRYMRDNSRKNLISPLSKKITQKLKSYNGAFPRYVLNTFQIEKWSCGNNCWQDWKTCVLCYRHQTEKNDPEIIKWMRDNGFNWDEDMCKIFARKGNLYALKRARENGCSWGRWDNYITSEKWLEALTARHDAAEVAGSAAEGGHIDILKWLRDNKCPWDDSLCMRGAARGGHIYVLKWLKENGCVWDEETCTGAALGGHLNVLKWLKKNGCLWNDRTTFHAAMMNNLEVLKWAVKNGCPWEKSECLGIAEMVMYGMYGAATDDGDTDTDTDMMRWIKRQSDGRSWKTKLFGPIK